MGTKTNTITLTHSSPTFVQPINELKEEAMTFPSKLGDGPTNHVKFFCGHFNQGRPMGA